MRRAPPTPGCNYPVCFKDSFCFAQMAAGPTRLGKRTSFQRAVRFVGAETPPRIKQLRLHGIERCLEKVFFCFHVRNMTPAPVNFQRGAKTSKTYLVLSVSFTSELPAGSVWRQRRHAPPLPGSAAGGVPYWPLLELKVVELLEERNACVDLWCSHDCFMYRRLCCSFTRLLPAFLLPSLYSQCG